MTEEEVFSYLENKYGEEFNWYVLPVLDRTFVEELKKEIGEKHFLYHKKIIAVAKCGSSDDVLFRIEHSDGTKEYYMFHLTYSKHNTEDFPKYRSFANIEAVKEEIEEIFVKEYL